MCTGTAFSITMGAARGLTALLSQSSPSCAARMSLQRRPASSPATGSNRSRSCLEYEQDSDQAARSSAGLRPGAWTAKADVVATTVRPALTGSSDQGSPSWLPALPSTPSALKGYGPLILRWTLSPCAACVHAAWPGIRFGFRRLSNFF